MAMSGRRAAAYFSYFVTRSQAPHSSLQSCRLLRSSLVRAAVKHALLDGEIQTQLSRPHIAMSYQPSIAWKASLTRIPPPICASALGSKTALVLRAVSAANEYRNTPSAASDNPLFVPRRLSLRLCCGAAIAKHESKFLNQRVDSRVSQVDARRQKIFIKNLRSISGAAIFKQVDATMGVSS
jgi:hypothetical protein